MLRDTIRPLLLFKVHVTPRTAILYEAMSYAWTELPLLDERGGTLLNVRIMARTKPGDPTTLVELDLTGKLVRSLGVARSEYRKGSPVCVNDCEHTVYGCLKKSCQEWWCAECRGGKDFCPLCSDIGRPVRS